MGVVPTDCCFHFHLSDSCCCPLSVLPFVVERTESLAGYEVCEPFQRKMFPL